MLEIYSVTNLDIKIVFIHFPLQTERVAFVKTDITLIISLGNL